MLIAVLVAYFAILAILCLFGIHRSFLVWLLHRNPTTAPQAPGCGHTLPSVLIQLPVFNEANVVERLLRAAGAIDYPTELLEIQVLDDSTDETTGIAERVCAELRAEGRRIGVVRRPRRTAFKAGALAHGLQLTPSDLVAVFDADFIPPTDFLHRTVAAFDEPEVGMVQCCWGHLNRNSSLLTALEAQLLDAHFLVEHDARFRSGRFFNFNGTAGIWRRQAISDAGGWQGDTLTEDLDLSYRAQMAGWRFIFLPDVVVPAELPTNVNAFKSQQRRWAKGSAQTARKLLGTILRAPLPRKVKIEAVFHLGGNAAYPLMLTLALLLLPNLVARHQIAGALRWLAIADALAVVSATCSLALFYAHAAGRAGQPSGLRLIIQLPLLMILGIGISVSNAAAVFEGLFGPVGSFVRTPKTGDAVGAVAPSRIRYADAVGWTPWIELLVAVPTATAVAMACGQGSWVSLPFLALFPIGYLAVSFSSLAPMLVHRNGRR